MAGCSDVARNLGITSRSVRRACERGDVHAVQNERGEYEIPDSLAAELRAEDVLRRQGSASPRASVLRALDAVRELCRVLGVDVEPLPVLDPGRLERARREAVRARREVEHAAGVSGRSSRRREP